MPKEVIYADATFVPETDGHPAEDLHPVFEVRWDKEGGFVQLVTRVRERELFAYHEQFDGLGDNETLLGQPWHVFGGDGTWWVGREHGERFIVCAESASAERVLALLNKMGGTIPAEYGFYVSVGWRALNDAIKVMRRARDATFGRPE